MNKTLTMPEIPPLRVKMTERFRSLKIGETLTDRFTHYESPHSTARLVGIRVKTNVTQKLENGFLIAVTRIEPRVKATAKTSGKRAK